MAEDAAVEDEVVDTRECEVEVDEVDWLEPDRSGPGMERDRCGGRRPVARPLSSPSHPVFSQLVQTLRGEPSQPNKAGLGAAADDGTHPAAE